MSRHFNVRTAVSAVLAAAVLLVTAPSAPAQTATFEVIEKEVYEPTWESLDKRNTPGWYRDAKFGIFIHWGLYSVPAWSPRGTYAEWYWHALDAGSQKGETRSKRHIAVNAFHNRVYGGDFEYADFRPMFTCEMFEPDQWAAVFKRSGAKYVVLTSKHHDGYCLWPNKEASRSFGTAWNSVESGPRRDLVGDLSEAVRSAGLKMGLYYSIWDWFNPYWPEEQQQAKDYGAGLKRYVHEVMYPQFKQIVTDYQPSLIFSDGDWWMGDDRWETRPLLAWLFNHAPNKDEVVVNDRWGQVRGQHGGYYTTEYGSGFDDPDVLWEENRGIGKSFGYNREETLDDYNSARLLVFMLVDIVSRGGNFLLDVGPTADGRIPVVMEDRLAEIGRWLDVNGEAIFGTRRWVTDAQWSDGPRPEFSKQDHHFGNPVFEMTVSPKPGNAVKQLYFTRKGATLYALAPGWPDGDVITVGGVGTSPETEISLLGCRKKLSWKQSASDVKIELANIGVNDLPCQHIYTFKITECRPAK